MKRISRKRQAQKRKEVELIQALLIRCNGLCEKCGGLPDFRGLSKHEIVFRSHGGDPLDPDNCLMLCGDCHAKEHHVF